MADKKNKRSGKQISRIIQKETSKLLNKPKRVKVGKDNFLISKEQGHLSSRAREYDKIVNAMLRKTVPDVNGVLIFNYQNGFVLTDMDHFGRYSVKL